MPKKQRKVGDTFVFDLHISFELRATKQETIDAAKNKFIKMMPRFIEIIEQESSFMHDDAFCGNGDCMIVCVEN